MASTMRCVECRIVGLELEAFQHVEHLEQHHAAGRRRRHRHDANSRDSCRAAPAARPPCSSSGRRWSSARRPRAPRRKSCRRPALRRTRAGRVWRSPQACRRDRTEPAACRARSASRRASGTVSRSTASAPSARSTSGRCPRTRRRPCSRCAPARSPARSVATSLNLPEPYFCSAMRQPGDGARHADGEARGRATSPDRPRPARRGRCPSWSRPARSRGSRWRCPALAACARWISMKPPPPMLPARG